MTLIYLGVIFDSKMTFEKHLCLCPEQLLKDMISRGSPGEHS